MTSVEIDYETISMSILPLLLIQGQLSVSGRKYYVHKVLLNRLEDFMKSVSRVTDRLNMSLTVLIGP